MGCGVLYWNQGKLGILLWINVPTLAFVHDFHRREYLGAMLLRFFTLCVLTALACSSFAQSATVAAGGMATGVGGTVSFSIGQVADGAPSAGTGMVYQGVQQPYVDGSTTVADPVADASGIAVYPNITADMIVVNTSATFAEPLRVEVSDAQGRTLLQRMLPDTRTELSLATLAAGSYHLSVITGTERLRTFTIVRIDHP